MIFQSFLLGNLLSLYMKIINSVVVVGLYYGFITTFSIWHSYLFLLRAQVMEEREEGTEKISATTGFITGQLMMFISIYYAPLHLALGRPHTITVLVLPYILYNFFFWNNHKHFFDYGSTTRRNSMHNLSIQCIFLNNLILQLFNHLILPSSMLARLVNIYMFRYNKMLFVTSSFFGWLMGQILFMKWVGLVLVFWIRQNNSIRWNLVRKIQSNKYLLSELRNYMARILSILLFITCVYFLVRIPSPILTNKLKETSEMEENGDNSEEEETDVEIEKNSGTKKGEEISSTEDPSPSLFSEERGDNDPVSETHYLDANPKDLALEILNKKDKKNFVWFWFEQPLVTLLFDYKKQWNRPLRYIKNDQFENAVRNEISQYFFYTCPSDGKRKISFTYPSSLLTFLEMIQRKIFLSTEKNSSNELYNYWIDTNEQKKNKQSNEFIKRIEVLDKKYRLNNILEQRTRLCCNNETKKKEYLPKIYDPFVNGSYRGTTKILYSPSIINESFIESHSIETEKVKTVWINKIHGIFFLTDSREFKQKKIDKNFDKKSLLSTKKGHFLTFISQFDKESTLNFNFKDLYFFPEQEFFDSEDREKFFKNLLNLLITKFNNQKKVIRKKSIGVKTIHKKVPRWSYKLIDELEQQEGENENLVAEDHEIRSRKAKRVILFTNNYQNIYTYDTYTNTKETLDPDQADDVALIRYSQQSDFRRDIIKCSMRTQRRKTGIWELFQANMHSPLFLDRRNKLFFNFEISKLMNFIFRNEMIKISKLKNSNYKEKERKKEMGKNEEDNKRKDKMRVRIAEAWDTILFAQVIRGCMLLIQSFLRKYMILPLLIIAKNISRILLFQIPEWSDDLREWKREIHVKCTYNGVQLSEKEFPKNWSTEGIQIKILFPFCLKPWHRSKVRSLQRDPMLKKKKIIFSFLTVWGMESELPFGSTRKQPSFFEPIFKKLKKKIIKLKNKFFLVLRVLKEKKWFLRISKKTKKWVIKKFLLFFLLKKRRIKNLSKGKILIFLGLKEDESSQTNKKEKDSIKNRMILNELSIQKGFMDWTKDSLTENKMNNLTDRRNTIRNQIERLNKDKKKGFLIPDIKMSSKKKSYKPKKRLESPKKILKIFKARLIIKSYLFIKNFIEKIYDTLLCIIKNISSLNAQVFLELTKKKFDKNYIYSEIRQDRIDKKNQTIIHLISTLKKSLNYISNSNNNSKKSSQIFCDLSLSQTYVFYKFSKIQVKNLDIRDVLQYHGTSFFLKNEKKDYFGIKGIFHPDSIKLRHKLWKSETKQWKNWLLRGHYQYDLSPIRWSRLLSQKWQNRVVNQHGTLQNINLNKRDFYEKVQLIHYKKKTDSYEEILLSNKKNNLKKYYRYDKRSHTINNYEYRNASYIYGSPLHVKLQVKKNERIDYYNYKTHKRKLLDLLGPIHNYLGEDSIRDMEKNMKVWWDFDCRIPHFCLNKLYIVGTLMDVDTGTNGNQNMKTGTKNYQIIDQMDKNQKNILYHLTIHQEIEPFNQKKRFLSWMGMDEEILKSPRSNTGLWFFPELVLLCNKYKIKQWFIPIKLLLFNFNENVWEKKNINARQKNIFRSSNEKYFELENRNKESNGLGNLGSDVQNQDNLESILSNQQNFLEEDYESNITKHRKKKQYKSHTEAELDLFLKSSFLFHQLRWKDSLNHRIIKNIKVYCLLLRQINPKETALSSIQRGEFCFKLMLNQKYFTLTELIKTGILIIEPVRRSVKNDIQFIMYQTVGISLVHKSKHQTNQRYQEKSVDKKTKKSIERHQKMFGKKDENDYYVFVPENILSAKRCREFRIRIEINSRNRKNVNRNPTVLNRNNVKNCSHFLDENEHFDNIRDKNLIKLKSFLWPNYRLEDLTCVNRYWYHTNNGSRFSLLRICPQVKIR